MGLLECASGDSVWRGYDYYKEKRVLNLIEISECCFQADVNGGSKNTYSVYIDVIHPRKSTCNCPHANGKRIVCKHMVATFFTAYPSEAEKFYNGYLQAQREAAQHEQALYERVQKYIGHMKKDELQQALIELLFSGPEWQFYRFVREHELDEY